MNKYLPLLVVATSALILGGCTQKESSTQAPAQMVKEANEFAKAIESGRPTLCVMTKGEDKMEYQIKGKKMRMHSISTTTDESGKFTTTNGYMINDEKYVYTWDEATKQGAKMAIPTDLPAEALAKEGEESDIPEQPNFQDKIAYQEYEDEGYTIKCETGNFDDSLFTPPTDVKFIDPSEMMKAIPSPDSMGNIDMSKLEELSKQYGVTAPEDQ